MIRPLRRRHRWIIPTLFLILAIAALSALTHPLPSSVASSLPADLDASAARVP